VVSPVKVISGTSGWVTNGAPASSPNPWTTLKTPGGKSASSKICASFQAVSGDHSAGFKITVLPVASAGAMRQVESIIGAFQGVMIPQGAYGNAQTVIEPLAVHWISPAVHGFLGVFGIKAEVFGGAGNLRADDLECLSSVEAFDGSQLIAVLFDQTGDFEQMLFSVFSLAVAPFLKRRVGRLRRAIDVFGVAAPGASKHAVGGRIKSFEGFATRALGPLAVDVMLYGGAGKLGANLIDKFRADARCWGCRCHFGGC
jgi:hypothetical protein